MGVPPLVHELELAPSRKTDLLIPRCGACGLHEHCSSPKMPVWGKGRKKVLVAGEAPGQTEDREGTPFVGKTGQLLRRTLASLGVDLDRDCWTTNSLRCWPWTWARKEGGSKFQQNRTPTDNEIDHCRPNMLNAVRELNPEVILLLGNAPVKSLVGWLWKEDPGGISRWAGWTIPCQRLNAWVVPTFHPSYLARRESEEPDPVLSRLWKKHLEAAFSLEGRPWKKLPDYASRVRRVLDPREAARELARLARGERPVAFDYETDRLKPDHPEAHIVCCSASDGETTIAYPWVGKAVQATRDFLRSPVPKIAQNMKFEERWTRTHLGCRVRNWTFDTMVAAHVLDNRPGIAGLKFQAFALLGQESYDDRVKPYLKSAGGGNAPNRLPEVVREGGLNGLLLYCGLDSLLEWEIAQIQAKKLGVKL